ncbi:MAG TPA: hypothetical protein VMW12_12190 [Candidatus Dormibacteraeota bacterium]|nr:hypothetical protein [Candidatus Dormibacteraeota bacterium]
MESAAPLLLRPLSIGEILDRAVTLYVRNFALFTLIILTVSLPMAIVQYAFAGSQAQSLQAAITILEHPTPPPDAGRPAKPPSPFGEFTAAQIGGLLIVIVVALVVVPLSTNAVAVGVAALYAGHVPAFGTCYAAVLRRWPSVLGTLIVWVGIGLAAYLISVFSLAILVGIGIGVVRASPALAIIFAALAVLLTLALLAVAVMAVLAASFSFFAVCIEGQPVGAAIRSGFARIFARDEARRALLVGLAYLGIDFGVVGISASVGIAVVLLLKNVFLQVALSTIAGALLSAFLTVFVAVYYYDVRIRREGFDLEADIQRLGA